MEIRDRIKDFRRVKASELALSPKNWRTHPKAQRDALQGLLAEIGFAGAVLARETPHGLMLIDGHLRAETAADSKIPVLVLDVNEDEADKILATFDPLGAMAITDVKAMRVLMEGLETANESVANMLAGMLETGRSLTPAFSPAILPEFSSNMVTAKDVSEKKEMMEGQFTDRGKQSIREVCCPSCGAEFGLEVR